MRGRAWLQRSAAVAAGVRAALGGALPAAWYDATSDGPEEARTAAARDAALRAERQALARLTRGRGLR
jgi:hypothetical protein